MSEQEKKEIDELAKLCLEADSKLSLLVHRGGIKWGIGIGEPYEYRALIGKLRAAYEKHLAPREGKK